MRAFRPDVTVAQFMALRKSGNVFTSYFLASAKTCFSL